MPAVSWPSEASFSRLDQAVLRGAQVLERLRPVRACVPRTLSNRRTFSIAITAWSAKVVTSSICLSVNGRTSVRVSARTPIGTPSRSIGTPRTVRKSPESLRLGEGVVGIGLDVGNVNDPALQQRAPDDRAAIRLHRSDR